MLDVTLLIPWNGADEDLLKDAIGCYTGIPYLVAQNVDKVEMAAAMNTALDDITTTWTLRMDADDLVPYGYAAMMVEAAGSADGAYPSLRSFGAFNHTNYADPWNVHRLSEDNYIPGPILVRTAALRAVGGWRPHPMEDWDLAYRLASAGYRLEPVRNAFYGYRRYHGSTNDRVAACLAGGDFSWEDMRETITGKREKAAWPAVFYASASAGVAYVRGTLMAEYMPGIVRETYAPDAHIYKAGVWHHLSDFAGEAPDHDRSLGRAVVVDVDDNYLSPLLPRQLERAARWNPALKAHAEMWRGRQAAHRDMCERADLIVCSTPLLADEYRAVNENVVVVRNSVEPLHWHRPCEDAPAREAPSGASRRIRVGWAAATQHGPDAATAMPALRYAASQPDVEVVCIGLDPDFDFPYTHVPMTPSLQAYRDVVSTLDIGIAPLKRGGINRWKSDLKWLEYTMGGAATVATRLDPYSTIRHGRTALLADDRDDLAHQVALLIGDEARRTTLAKAAKAEVLAERTSLQASAEYLAALETIGVREEVAA